MTFPFVFAGEGGGAACEGEDADEGAGVGGCDVAGEVVGVFEGRGVAGFAG